MTGTSIFVVTLFTTEFVQVFKTSREHHRRPSVGLSCTYIQLEAREPAGWEDLGVGANVPILTKGEGLCK